MENGTLARCLSSIDLQMYDVIKARSGIQGPNTFIRGSRQIDGAWATPDINVKAACFLPFFFGIGDHRGIVLDIPRDQLIGGNSKSIAKPVARRLRCDESRIWSAYNQRLVLYIRQHRIQAKIDHITNNVILSKEAQRRALHAIDQVVTEGMISAEKKCRKFHKGNVPFSPQLSKVGLVIRLWSLVIRHHLGANINTRYVRRIARKCSVERVLSTTLANARVAHEKAITDYKKLKRSANRLRQEFLRERADMTKNPKAKKEIIQIMKREEIRRSWRTVNQGRGKQRLKGISTVEILQEDNT